MKKTILIIAFLTGCLNITAQCYCDSLREVKNLCELEDAYPKKGLFYRSYNITFDPSNGKIDTLWVPTERELEEIARIIKSDSTIKQVKINVHLDKGWSRFYFSHRLDIMYEDIISHLVRLGIKREILSGKQYYNKCPLIKTKDSRLDSYENSRVEFVFE